MKQDGQRQRYDAIIGGGGPTGLTMALALAHVFDGDARIAVVDPAARAQLTLSRNSDPRAWAISAASVNLLRALDLWQAIESDAQPVTEIEITDSALEAGIRPVLLSYDNQVSDGVAAAHIVPNQSLLSSLNASVACRHDSIDIIAGASITSFETHASGAVATLDNGDKLTADLVIAADGRNSQLRDLAGIKTVQWQYDQLGIVTTVSHERPHGGKAVQHFLPGGPFAMLPLTGNRTCITWSEETETARQIMAADDVSFLSEVQRRFGGKLGLLELAGERTSFPLGMHLARDFVATRIGLIGDTAHGVHPIAGQGLNLAFRDVAALAECIDDGVRAGLSFGDFTILERYQSWRRFDATLSAGAFDAINRLFSNDTTLLRSAREVGLGLVDRVPQLKQFFVREAAGLTGDVPRLLQLVSTHDTNRTAWPQHAENDSKVSPA